MRCERCGEESVDEFILRENEDKNWNLAWSYCIRLRLHYDLTQSNRLNPDLRIMLRCESCPNCKAFTYDPVREV